MTSNNHRTDGQIQGIIAVIQRNREFLVIQRAEGLLAAGSWCFVGGAIEQGETQADALMREVREEVGLNVTPGQKVWEWTRPDNALRLHFWTAAASDYDMTLNHKEVRQARWLDQAQIRKLEGFLPNGIEFLDQYLTTP